MNNLKVFTAFSGYDSQCMALDRLGINYNLIGWSEIDKYAIQAHNAIYPQYSDRNYGDISKIDWNNVPDFDLFTYSSPCFVGDTLVMTSNGYKEIKNIEIGDMVLTKEGDYKKCTDFGGGEYKHIYQLKIQGMLPIKCTNNHPFWTLSRHKIWNNNIRRDVYIFDEPCKKRYDELKINDDFIGVPIIKESIHSDYSNDELWLLGRFIADGHQHKNGNIIFSIGSSKLEDFLTHTSNNKVAVYNHSQSCIRCIFNRHTKVYDIVQKANIKNGAINKSFTNWILSLEVEQLKKVIEGYVSGDGCFLEKTKHYSATTISKELALSLTLAVQKAYKVGCLISYHKVPKTHIIEGRLCNQHDTYSIRWSLNTANKHYIVKDDFIWYPVKKMEDLNIEEPIFNITVEDSHTYTAYNCSVGNCQDFSSAGLQKGGAEGSGTRSSLLWECRKAIITKKPKFLLFENVKSITSKKFMPTFQKWIDELISYGYSNYWKILNTKDFGLGHNRERVFMISILGNEKFEFPNSLNINKKREELLETNVDENFYLNYKETIPISYNIIDNSIKRELYNTDKDGDIFCLKADYYKMGKANFLKIGNSGFNASCVKEISKLGIRYRKLTPTECFRFMGVNDNDINKILNTNLSNTQKFKMAGNSIVVDVLYYILKYLFKI